MFEDLFSNGWVLVHLGREHREPVGKDIKNPEELLQVWNYRVIPLDRSRKFLESWLGEALYETPNIGLSPTYREFLESLPDYPALRDWEGKFVFRIEKKFWLVIARADAKDIPLVWCYNGPDKQPGGQVSFYTTMTQSGM